MPSRNGVRPLSNVPFLRNRYLKVVSKYLII